MFVFWTPYDQLWTPTAGSECKTEDDTRIFRFREAQYIHCILCSWPAPKTRLRSFYMTLLWTVEIHFKVLPVGSMSKALSCSLRMTVVNWYLDLSPAVWRSLASSMWQHHTEYTCSLLALKVMASRDEKWRFSLKQAVFGKSQLMHVVTGI